MHCSVCGLDLPTTKQRNIIAGDNRNVATTILACDHCASYYKDTPTAQERAKMAEKAREEAYEALKPVGWPTYAKWPLSPTDTPPPGWALTSDGWKNIS